MPAWKRALLLPWALLPALLMWPVCPTIPWLLGMLRLKRKHPYTGSLCFEPQKLHWKRWGAYWEDWPAHTMPLFVVDSVGDAETVAHEQVHIWQRYRLGPLFDPLWLYWTKKHGYDDNPLEREARERSENP